MYTTSSLYNDDNLLALTWKLVIAFQNSQHPPKARVLEDNDEVRRRVSTKIAGAWM